MFDLKETADIIAGYVTGRLYVENGVVGLRRSDGGIIPLDDGYSIEVRNESEYVAITIRQAQEAVTSEGWPLYAGLYVRAKLVNAITNNGGNEMKKITVGWTGIDTDGTERVFNWVGYILADDLAVIIDYESNRDGESITIARVKQAEEGRYIPQRGVSGVPLEVGHDDMDTVLERMRAADNPLDLLIAALAV